MNIKHITPDYAVTPQIEPGECQAIADAGFSMIICNRPDGENPPALQAAEIEKAAKDAGLAFHAVPLTHQTMTPDNLGKHASYVDSASGPVLAYCASGTRSSIAWALSQRGTQSADAILQQTANAGYDLSGLRGALEG